MVSCSFAIELHREHKAWPPCVSQKPERLATPLQTRPEHTSKAVAVRGWRNEDLENTPPPATGSSSHESDLLHPPFPIRQPPVKGRFRPQLSIACRLWKPTSFSSRPLNVHPAKRNIKSKTSRAVGMLCRMVTGPAVRRAPTYILEREADSAVTLCELIQNESWTFSPLENTRGAFFNGRVKAELSSLERSAELSSLGFRKNSAEMSSACSW